MSAAARKPSLLKRGDTFYLNAGAILRWLFELDLDDVGEPRQRQRIQRYQERAQAALAAETIRAQPREVDDVLWSTFLGAELDEKMKELGPKVVDWILDQAHPS